MRFKRRSGFSIMNLLMKGAALGVTISLAACGFTTKVKDQKNQVAFSEGNDNPFKQQTSADAVQVERFDQEAVLRNMIDNEAQIRQQEDQKLQAEIDAIKLDLANLRGELVKEISDREEADAEIRKDVAAADAELKLSLESNFDTKLAALSQELRNFTAVSVEQLGREVNEARQKEIDALQKRYDGLISSIQKQISDDQAKMAANEKQAAADRELLDKTIAGLEQEISNTKAELDALDEQSAQSQAKIVELQDKSASLQSELTASNASLSLIAAKANEESLRLSGEIGSLREELGAHVAQYGKEKQAIHEEIARVESSLAARVKVLEDFRVYAQNNFATKEELAALAARTVVLENTLSALVGDLTEEASKKLLDKLAEGDKANAQAVLALRGELFDESVGIIPRIHKDLSRLDGDIKNHNKVTEEDVSGVVALIKSGYSEDLRRVFAEVQAANVSLADNFESIMNFAIKYQTVSVKYKAKVSAMIEVMKGKPNPDGINLAAAQSALSEVIALEQSHIGQIEAKIGAMKNQLADLKKLAEDSQKALLGSAQRLSALEGKLVGIDGTVKEALEKVKTDLQAEIQASQAEVLDAAVSYVDEMGESMQDQFQHLANSVTNLQIKQNALLAEHEELAKSVLKKPGVSQALLDTAAAKQAATSSATVVLSRSLLDLRFALVGLMEPRQEEVDFYDHALKAAIYTRFTGEQCDYTANASFANAMGVDSFMHIAHQYVFEWVTGQIQGSPSLIAGVPELEKLAVLRILNAYEAVKAPECLDAVKNWAHLTLHDRSGLLKHNNRTLLETFALSENLDYSRKKKQVEAALVSFRNAWREYQDALVAIDKSAVDHLSVFASQAIDKAMTDEGLRGLKDKYQQVVGDIKALQDNKADKESAVCGSDPQAFACRLKALEESQAKFEGLVSQRIEERISKLSLPDMSKSNAAMKEMMKVVAVLSERAGYPDLKGRATTAYKDFSGETMSDNEFKVTPFIAQVQHFYGSLYKDVKDGVIRNAKTGEPIANLTGSAAAGLRASMDSISKESCHSAKLTFGAGDNNYNYAKTSDPCWVNFRSTTLASQHDRVVENVMFRVIGSADAIRVQKRKYKNQAERDSSLVGWKAGDARLEYDKIFTVKSHDDGSAQAYIGEKIIPEVYPGVNGSSKADLGEYEKAIKDYEGSYQFTKVRGNNIMGAYDIYASDVLKRYLAGSTRGYWENGGGLKIWFTPIRVKMNNAVVAGNPYGDVEGAGINRDFGNIQYTEGQAVSHNIQLYSPLVLDFVSVGSLKTLNQLADVRFDLDTDGYAEATGWVDGREGAFLALDRNGNGVIDNGSELFGEFTKLANGRNAKNGYEALAQYDSNRDGAIDQADAVFSKLVVWSDYNRDGRSSHEELSPLGTKQVTRIALSYQELAEGDQYDNGNMLKYRAKFFGPPTCPQTGCNSYDVYFGTTVPLTQK